MTTTAVRFQDIALSEWTKIRSLRSTAWSFAALVVVSVGFSILATSIYTANWDHLSADDRVNMVEDPIGLILQPGAAWGQIAMCVLGVLLFAGEYSTGMIRATMLAVPRRTPVLAAKFAVLAAHGAEVEPDGVGVLVVAGMPAPRIAELAAQQGLVLYELTPQRASLEDAFMALTHGSVEFDGADR